MEIIINSIGTTLSKDNNGFTITNMDGKHTIPVTGIKTIQVSRGAQISSDAVMFAVENEIEVLFTDRTGHPVARIWSPKYGSISTIRKGQLAFTMSPKAVEWIKTIILAKIENQQALLLMMPAERVDQYNLINTSINRLEGYRTKIKEINAEAVSDIASTLRGWEGVASKIYFDTMNQFLPEEYQFEKRSQHPAMDIANALLNYGYGTLYRKIEGALIKAGIDPYIGIMHRDEYNRPVLVYDIIEKYRVWIDYVVFSLLTNYAITDEHFSVKEDGSYWLEQLGRRVLIQSINDYMDEVVDNNGMSRSRATQITLYAQELAQIFKKYN